VVRELCEEILQGGGEDEKGGTGNSLKETYPSRNAEEGGGE